MSINESLPSMGLSRTLYEEFRARIADGTYDVGAALPSTRTLAAERGLSRTTVTLVYEQLAADGFIETRLGAASRVVAGVAQTRTTASGYTQQAEENEHAGRLSSFGDRVGTMTFVESSPAEPREIDFVYGPLAGSDFPTLTWLKALRKVERQRKVRLEYEDPRGNLSLRKALQAHLSRNRGLACSVEQLMVVNGSQQALDLCARLLLNPGDRVIVENPGYRLAHSVFDAYGAELVGVDVDDYGIEIEQLAEIQTAQMAFVTPTHQFPLGAFLPVSRRHALLAWAAAKGTWIIEDDYDSEYRYSVRPEPTLQSLDPCGCVIHVGTFSKTLSPQLRLGYMVLPPRLVNTFRAAKRLADRHAPTGVQRALALLLEDGSYDRHVRSMRRKQHIRQQALIIALDKHLGHQVEVQGAASGLHLITWFPQLSASLETRLAQFALELGVRVYPISPLYCFTESKSRVAGLVMGYSLLDGYEIDEGVRRLAVALRKL